MVHENLMPACYIPWVFTVLNVWALICTKYVYMVCNEEFPILKVLLSSFSEIILPVIKTNAIHQTIWSHSAIYIRDDNKVSHLIMSSQWANGMRSDHEVIVISVCGVAVGSQWPHRVSSLWGGQEWVTARSYCEVIMSNLIMSSQWTQSVRSDCEVIVISVWGAAMGSQLPHSVTPSCRHLCDVSVTLSDMTSQKWVHCDVTVIHILWHHPVSFRWPHCDYGVSSCLHWVCRCFLWVYLFHISL